MKCYYCNLNATCVMHKKQLERNVCDIHRDKLLDSEWNEGRDIEQREYIERKYERERHHLDD